MAIGKETAPRYSEQLMQGKNRFASTSMVLLSLSVLSQQGLISSLKTGTRQHNIHIFAVPMENGGCTLSVLACTYMAYKHTFERDSECACRPLKVLAGSQARSCRRKKSKRHGKRLRWRSKPQKTAGNALGMTANLPRLAAKWTLQPRSTLCACAPSYITSQ